MAVSVDIGDRLYDYTDEEKATEALNEFQLEMGLSDQDIIALWDDLKNPRRFELDRRIVAAIDKNGSARRAAEEIPSGVTLVLEQASALSPK